MKIPINKEEYSHESKRSIGHDCLGEHYKDIEYKCFRCQKDTLFSAAEQKQAYEVRKEYMWAYRKLCDPCWRKMRTIKSELLRVEDEYCKNKTGSLSSNDFLSEWLRLLKIYPQYGKKANDFRIEFVKKHLATEEIQNMNLNKYIHELDRLQDDGALIFIKWDGERNRNRKTFLIEKPGTDYLFRRDTDNLPETIKEGIADYDALFNT